MSKQKLGDSALNQVLRLVDQVSVEEQGELCALIRLSASSVWRKAAS